MKLKNAMIVFCLKDKASGQYVSSYRIESYHKELVLTPDLEQAYIFFDEAHIEIYLDEVKYPENYITQVLQITEISELPKK
jgi:hypothetical protein